MNSQENPQATLAEPKFKQSLAFKLWKKLLAKRKNSIAIRVLCFVLIAVATLTVYFIQALIGLIVGCSNIISNIGGPMPVRIVNDHESSGRDNDKDKD